MAGDMPAWPRRPGPVLEWLVREGRTLPTAQAVLEALSAKLLEAEVPLYRATFNLRTLHPQLRSVSIIWRRDRPGVETIFVEHGAEFTPRYENSPIRVLFEGAGGVRQRLDVAEEDLEFPIYRELRAEGVTDYVGLPMTFSDGLVHGTTWQTDRAGGFSTEDLIRIDDLLPLIAVILEAKLTRRIARTLLDTYVGHHAGERILRGQIRRGSGETVRAAIWFCDLRGFTALSERRPRDELIDFLNQYFDCMAEPVERHGGEILKFVGDGMLAIFPLETDQACWRALQAAIAARAAMEELNAARRERGQETLAFGLALHAGEVMYGNIGSRTRLDFTVIGPAVNLTVRIETLCRALGVNILLSDTFATLCTSRFRSLGTHQLPGIARLVEVFTLAEPA